jgi:hypothetical protein
LLARGPTNNTSYTWDGLGRLKTATEAFIGGTGNSIATFGYNPASQIVALSRTNDLYAAIPGTQYLIDDRPRGA